MTLEMATSKDDVAMVRRSTRYNHHNKRPIAFEYYIVCKFLVFGYSIIHNPKFDFSLV
jgi:hypothetical protein